MTLPYPAPTDPAGAAARHIRNLAEATDAKLAAAAIVVNSFKIDQAANGNGDIFSNTFPVTAITGAVFGPAVYVGGSFSDSSWIPLVTRIGTAPAMTLRCYNTPNLATNAGRRQCVVGLCWGPRAAAADQAAAAPAAADTFGRGITPVGKLRYPGTDEPLYGTAGYIKDLATDTDTALGGIVPGLRIVNWSKGDVTTDANGYAQYNVSNLLSVVRGAVLTAWDTGNFVRKSRNICWYPPNGGAGAPVADNLLRMIVVSNVAYSSAPNNYPKKVSNETLGVHAILWGDPPL